MSGGPGTDKDAALAEVMAARQALLGEVRLLEASARDAADIPARIRRQPAKSAGIAAATAFVVFGGPGRLARRAKRVVRGPGAEFPPSLLPDEVEQAIRRLGPDGDRVRGTLEREFVGYLDERAKIRKRNSAGDIAGVVAKNLLRPISFAAGRRVAAEILSPESGGIEGAMERARARYEGARKGAASRGKPRASSTPTQGRPGSAGTPPPPTQGRTPGSGAG